MSPWFRSPDATARRPVAGLLLLLLLLLSTRPALPAPAAPAELSVAGEWKVRVRVADTAAPIEATLEVAPPTLVTVTAERYEAVPWFNPRAGGWVKGAQLRGVRAQETTTPFLLDPASLVLRSGPAPDAPAWAAGKDYDVDLDWGTFGRKPGGGMVEGPAVFASYRYAPLRLDAIVLDATGSVLLRPGEPRAAAPQVPRLEPGDRHLANVWIPGRIARLTGTHLFSIVTWPSPPAARTTTPKKSFRRSRT